MQESIMEDLDRAWEESRKGKGQSSRSFSLTQGFCHSSARARMVLVTSILWGGDLGIQ